MTFFAELEGERTTSVELFVGARGAWVADIELPVTSRPSGTVTLTLGDLELSGTVDPTRSGSFQSKSRVCVVAGANGWGKTITSQHFHNDTGIKASVVANAVAAKVGETIESAPGDVVGVDFIVAPGAASRVLNSLYPQGWRVDYDGKTRIGRAADSEVAGAYDLIDFNPRHMVAELSVSTPSLIKVGSILRGRLDLPVRVVALEYHVKEQSRMYVWVQEVAS